MGVLGTKDELMYEDPAGDGLGSLAQAARLNQLKSARAILIFVGVLWILINGLAGLWAPTIVDKELAAGVEVPGLMREQLIRAVQLYSVICVGIGVIYVILGVSVPKYPVPITITALVLFLGCWAVFGMLDPANFVSAWLFKILIVAGLVKAVQAAIAFEKEKRAQADELPLPPLA